MSFGDSNLAKPIGSSVSGGNGCTLKEYIWTISQNGHTTTVTNNGTVSIGGLPSWPKWLTTGTVTVKLKVVSTCGGTATDGPKTYEIVSPPTCGPSNRAPVFTAGFVNHGNSGAMKRLDSAFPGDWLDVQIIQESLDDPPTPYDPDGDSYYYMWDWEGAAARDPWLKKYYTDYQPWVNDNRFSFPFSMILTTADMGTHYVEVSATDRCGNSNTVRAGISVIAPNPVPIITLPPKVVEGRPFTPDISGTNSYSPKGYTISGYDWYGTKLPVYPTAGAYPIKLDVTDSMGLRSLSPATATLNVLPDLPPLADATLPSKGLRGVPMNMKDTSYSPDGDILVERSDTVICDTNFNGSFADDPATTLTRDSDGNMVFTPDKLAHCVLKVYAKEDWGKSASKEIPFDIVNRQPDNQIDVKGENPLPPVVDGIQYSMADLLTDSNRFRVEDTLQTSRLPGLFYDATEQALGAPDRQTQLYNIPTNGTFTISNTGFDTKVPWHMGHKGKYIPMQTRAGKNFWYFFEADSNSNYAPYGMLLHLFDARINTARTYNPQTSQQWSYYVKVNPGADMLWVRKVSHPNQCNYDYTKCPQLGYVVDELYKVSSLVGGNDSPYYQSPYTRWSGYSVPGQYAAYWIPTNPPPAGWIEPAHLVKPDGPLPTWNLNNSGSKSYTPETLPSFRDKQGNSYGFSCTSRQEASGWDDDGNPYIFTVYSCNLQKISPAGDILWTGSKVYTNKAQSSNSVDYHAAPKLDVVYVTQDNSKIITNDGIYDNVTGAYIGQIPYSDFSFYDGAPGWCIGCTGPRLDYGYGSSTWRPIFQKQYQDVIYYTALTPTQIPWSDSSYTKYTNHHILYNIRTGQTLLDVTSGSSNSRNNVNDTTTGEMTADGKLLIPFPSYVVEQQPSQWGPYNVLASRHEVRVYDMVTGAQLMTTGPQATGLGPLCNNYNNGGRTQIVLTGDGEGYLWYGSLDTDGDGEDWNDNCYGIRKFSFSGSSTSGNRYTYGNIVDQSTDLENGSLYVSVRYTDTTFGNEVGAGITFREQDNRNFYQAELAPEGVVLSKTVDGVRTQLAKEVFPLPAGKYSELKVKLLRNHIVVSVNGVPMIDVYDSQFASGKYGIFANAPNLYMKHYHVEKFAGSSTMLDNVVLVDAPIQYSVRFTDPDNDPAIPQLGTWTFTNLEPQKFLDAGDGKSDTAAANSYENRVVNTPFASIHKVGIFRVSFSEPDDPAPTDQRYPDPAYEDFRLYADPDTKLVAVHRRPVSLFTAWQKEDHTIGYADQSYDPDRWLSETRYSVEKPEFAMNRGIYRYLYSYTTPSGNTLSGKLARPSETGTYTLRQAVADEYGAWSEWYERDIYVEVLPPNGPPAAVLTYPNGTYIQPAATTTHTPTIRWSQSDPDPGTTFTQVRITVKEEWGTVLIDRTVQQNTAAPTGEWTVDTALPGARKLQVQVMVQDDGNAWSPWSNTGWMTINDKPSVAITDPLGTEAVPAVIQSDRRPVISWYQTDPDRLHFNKYYLEIIRPDGTMVWNSGWDAYQNSTSYWNGCRIPVDLPTGEVLGVRMKVTDHDDAMWSDWSRTEWFRINLPPWAEIASPRGTFYDPALTSQTPLIRWSQQDPDPNTVFTARQIRIRQADETLIWQSPVLVKSTTEPEDEHQIADPFPAGMKLQIEVKVWDQDGAESPWSAPQWILTNRPPLASFQWLPQPVWEGDMVRITSTSTDPDGNPLTYEWSLESPDGDVLHGSGPEWLGRFSLPGDYRVRLRVSDGLLTDEAVRTIHAAPLTIRSEVNHTSEWLRRHQELGHQTETVPKDFYSGERLLVQTTAAPAPVREARAWLEEESMDGGLIRIDAVLLQAGTDPVYTGELYDERLGSLTERLPNGTCTVHFLLIYANGVEKREDVPITIIGSVHQSVQVHRVQ
ncbi:PKD domain-containing protein [Gorillibacterium sp. sgz5001074]|uniref:glycoside hydrolase family 78 protein n=1 Tax=Gorillibacterium sp. sgz5001074 TaxID=3446695 RepID=UPI003F66E576